MHHDLHMIMLIAQFICAEQLLHAADDSSVPFLAL